jgi:hypothetical protein|tara:strand:- start:3896 stop:4369 length:474 start_codon:yes stop_codon:yes gene_type:complete
MNKNLFYLIVFVSTIALSRIIPHPPNFTPILAVAIMAPMITGATLSGIAIALGSMMLSDLYFGWHNTIGVVYMSIALCSFIPRYINNAYLAGSIASVLFFVITNFAVWLSGYYGLTWQGLVACYIAAIPFFANTLIGTLFYTLIIKSVVTIQRRIYA